jgi:hypothetical protein
MPDLSPEDQVKIEATTAYLVRRYGAAALESGRERHRADIWLAYGVCEPRHG